MNKLLKKLLVGVALLGAGFLLFTKKGQQVQQEIKDKLPALKDEVMNRYERSRKTFDEVVDEVVDEWKSAQRIMGEAAAPIKREIKRRFDK